MAEGYYDRGISFLEVKDYEKAIVEFQRSIKTDAGYKRSYYALGVVGDLMGKYAAAEKFYKKAIAIDSEYSEAHNALGVIYLKQNKWKDAKKEFLSALDNKLYATPHVPYLNLGDLYMAQRDYTSAIIAYGDAKQLVNQDIKDIAIYKLGQALVAGGRMREGIQELQEGVALAPKNADMRLALGTAYLKDGNRRAAMGEFRKVVELAPKTESARTAQDYIATIERDERKAKLK